MTNLLLPLPAGYGLSATERRGLPGRAYLGEWTHRLPRVTAPCAWMRGTDKQLSRIPYHIALMLDNRDFASFDALRKRIWQLIAGDALVSDIYADPGRRQRAISEGIAPLAPEGQQINRTTADSYRLSGTVKHRVSGSRPGLDSVILESERVPEDLASYQLHHHRPIHREGGVYEISNLIVVTPLMHANLLTPEYHYGTLETMPEWKQQYIRDKIEAQALKKGLP